MEAKKNPRADLNRYRSMMLMAGLAISLGAAVSAFNYSQKEVPSVSLPPLDYTEEVDIPPIPTRPEEPVKPKVQKIDLPTQLLLIDNHDPEKIGDFNWDEWDMDAPVVPSTKVPMEEPAVDDSEIFIVVEQMPQFMGGDVAKFRAWVMEKLRYPEIAAANGISGRVTLSFVIETDGALTNVEVLQTPDRLLSQEAERVLLTSPVWTPGHQRTVPVRVKYTIPVEFRLN